MHLISPNAACAIISCICLWSASPGALAQAPDRSAAVADIPGGPAKLTFRDEFDGKDLNRSVWSTNYTNVLTNLPGELQIYTPDSFEVGQGTLKIRSDKRTIDGFEYTSGAMTTFGAFNQTYGFFEMRAKLPRGAGLWPAFWMLPQDKSWPPEIDVMEFLGKDTLRLYTTYHWTDEKREKREEGASHSDLDWTAAFHTFAVQWRPDLLVWYIDGKEVKRITGPHIPKTPMFMLLNLAVGGSWAGPPNAATRFPATYEIDYVRAYQYADIPPQPRRDWRYLPAVAGPTTASPGQEVTFRFGLENTTSLGDVHLQARLVDSTGKRTVGQNNQTVQASRPGEIVRSWTTRLPSDLKPGLYVLGLGVFDKNWKQLDWLNNATTILVR